MFNAITKKSITLLMVIVLIFSIGITAFASYDYDEIDYNNFQEDDSDYDNTHETISDYDYVIDDVSDYDHINEDLIIKDYYTATMSSNGPLVSPGAQVVEEIGGSLYVNNIKV